MHPFKFIPVLALSLIASTAQAGVPGFGLPKPVPQPEKMFVVFNGVACFVAPCPSYTAVTEDGEVIELSNVDLPEKTKPALADALMTSGLEVEGVINQGSFEPNGDGTTLVVSKVIKDAKVYSAFHNGIVCAKAPCPSFTTVTQAGARRKVSAFDFSAINDPSEEGNLETALLAGEIVVSGFLVPDVQPHFVGAGTKLLVMKIVSVTQTFTLSHSGIVCIVAPCPSIAATPVGGGESINVTDVNLKAVTASKKEQAELFQTLLEGTLQLQGYIAHNQQTFGQGTVLHVLDVE